MKYELLGDIIIKQIKNNISSDDFKFYSSDYRNHINLNTVKTLAKYAVLQFLKAKNFNINLSDFREFDDYIIATQIIKDTKLENIHFISLAKYSMIKQNKLILSTKCYKKLSLTEEVNQRNFVNRRNFDLER